MHSNNSAKPLLFKLKNYRKMVYLIELLVRKIPIFMTFTVIIEGALLSKNLSCCGSVVAVLLACVSSIGYFFSVTLHQCAILSVLSFLICLSLTLPSCSYIILLASFWAKKAFFLGRTYWNFIKTRSDSYDYKLLFKYSCKSTEVFHVSNPVKEAS